jgi:hypothetical protein
MIICIFGELCKRDSFWEGEFSSSGGADPRTDTNRWNAFERLTRRDTFIEHRFVEDGSRA